MAAMGNTAQSDFFKLLFQNTTWANVGDATGIQASGTAGSLYAALSTGTLTGASSQNTTEAAYTGYARVAVARSSGGWTISGSSPTTVSNTAATTFPQSSSGPETETYFNVGRASSSTGEVIAYAALTASLVVNNLITPSFASAQLAVTIT